MNIFKVPVHPAAAVFPMLSDDELNELAEDIKANGLLQPIVVKDGVLIDGRNRREACRRAGVEPRVEELNGTDPVAYILATNVNRRHLTKGQRAMAVAKLYPEGQDRGRGKKGSQNEPFGVVKAYVSEARTVLRWLPEVADRVMAGAKPLNEAYAEAQQAKDASATETARLGRLREHAADLADAVDDGQLRLTEAEAAYTARIEDARRARQTALNTLDSLDQMFDVLAANKSHLHLADVLTQHDDQQRARTLIEQWLHALTATRKALR